MCSVSKSIQLVQVREATAEAKAQFDNAELALQNLLYEKAYYLKEIRACRSFRCCICCSFPSFSVTRPTSHCPTCTCPKCPCWLPVSYLMSYGYAVPHF